jgi:hypothetical protein
MNARETAHADAESRRAVKEAKIKRRERYLRDKAKRLAASKDKGPTGS